MSKNALRHSGRVELSQSSSAPPHIEWSQLAKLRPNPRNARTHSKKQIRQIADSIKRFGFLNPLIVDASGQILAGHGRAEAAKLVGFGKVPTIQVSNLTDTELRAYALADNKLAEKAGWDRELLSLEIEELQVGLAEVNLDIGITGFEPAEIDSLLSDFEQSRPNNPADEIPPMLDTVAAREGDTFVLGQHRLTVEDARDQRVYERLMLAEKATMAFHDPPYNVPVNGHVGGRGRIKHREFAHASGEMSSDRFIQFLQQSLTQSANCTEDGGITYVCMDWRHIGELLKAGAAVYDELKNICVWAKTTPGQGSFYRSQHELVFVYKQGQAPHINTFELGQHGRTRTNVWTYPGANTFRAGRLDALKMHPTVKPIALVSDAMRDCSRRGSIVLDSFCGSGTTIMAAENIGRRAFCVEIDPQYVDVAISRWQRFTGKDAVLESTGQTVEELRIEHGKKTHTSITRIVASSKKSRRR